MCTFLTVAVAPKRQQALINALRGASLQVAAQRNPSVSALFASDEALLLVTHAGCSCDLRPQSSPSKAQRAEALRHRGLTEGQLKRALEVEPAPRRIGAVREALVTVLRAHAPVRLLFHEVTGDPQSEAVPPGLKPEADVQR